MSWLELEVVGPTAAIKNKEHVETAVENDVP